MAQQDRQTLEALRQHTKEERGRQTRRALLVVFVLIPVCVVIGWAALLGLYFGGVIG